MKSLLCGVLILFTIASSTATAQLVTLSGHVTGQVGYFPEFKAGDPVKMTLDLTSLGTNYWEGFPIKQVPITLVVGGELFPTLPTTGVMFLNGFSKRGIIVEYAWYHAGEPDRMLHQDFFGDSSLPENFFTAGLPMTSFTGRTGVYGEQFPYARLAWEMTGYSVSPGPQEMTPVPESATLGWLAGCGLVTLLAVSRRKRVESQRAPV
jgi:hypothetical protein